MMTPKYNSTNQTRQYQSALGRYKHGGVGHSHGWPEAEGEDGVVLPLVVPCSLLMNYIVVL